MPSAHRRYRDWTHERIRHEAQAVGPDAAVLVDVILRSRAARWQTAVVKLRGSGASTLSRPASRSPAFGKGPSLPSVESCRRRGLLYPHFALITITRIDDHLRPESVITFHRIR
jgi:hypothetical protein